MIRIGKGDAPVSLVRAGAAPVREMMEEYEADPGAFRTGEKKFEFDANIYGSKAVKDSLKASHHGKCCYCETKIEDPYAFGHVEHYRPKMFSIQDRLSPPEKPGYYWLAYDWNNLLLSCHFCNSSNKGNLFPLHVPGDRARSHSDDLAREVPLLVKPDEDDGVDGHIDFIAEIPVGLTVMGRRTIDVLRLDSPRHERRLSHYVTLQRAHGLVNDLSASSDPLARGHADRFRAFLQAATHASSEYSALSRKFLTENPLPPSAT